MGLGFILYQFRNQTPRINKRLSIPIWIFAISVLVSVILGFFPFQQSENYFKISNVVNASYNALHRSCWAIAIAWVIFSCHNGDGGIIREFLSHSFFKPFAKMSLSVYLTHRIHQKVSVAAIKQPIYLSPLELIYFFFGDIVLSFIFGTVAYLCIEAPFAILERRVIKKYSISK